MGYAVLFVLLTLVIEFVIMLLSYDDFFDNIGWSIFWSFFLTMIVLGINEAPEGMCKPKKTEQEQQLQAQEDSWGADVVDEVLAIEAIEQKEVDEYYEEQDSLDKKVDRLVDLIETIPSQLAEKKARPVPSTSSYIDGSRREYSFNVTYDIETREACFNNACFKAQTVQHTDGTFWACRRNYGTCYQY